MTQNVEGSTKTCSFKSPTWKFNPLVRITERPDVHHHVHATGGKVLIIRGPGQRNWFGMMSIKLILYLEGEGNAVKQAGNCIMLDIQTKRKFYRISICHAEDGGYFLFIEYCQIRSIVRIGHVRNGPFSIKSFTLLLQSVALDGVQVDFSILETDSKYVLNVTRIIEN